jgi:hypothetical protein
MLVSATVVSDTLKFRHESLFMRLFTHRWRLPEITLTCPSLVITSLGLLASQPDGSMTPCQMMMMKLLPQYTAQGSVINEKGLPKAVQQKLRQRSPRRRFVTRLVRAVQCSESN